MIEQRYPQECTCARGVELTIYWVCSRDFMHKCESDVLNEQSYPHVKRLWLLCTEGTATARTLSMWNRGGSKRKSEVARTHEW